MTPEIQRHLDRIHQAAQTFEQDTGCCPTMIIVPDDTYAAVIKAYGEMMRFVFLAPLPHIPFYDPIEYHGWKIYAERGIVRIQP